MHFPRLVYKSESTHMLVEDSQDFDAAILAGWFASVPDALAPPVAVPVIPPTVPDDNAPPTRSELEAKAKELGLKFDGRNSDARLGKMIEEALHGLD